MTRRRGTAIAAAVLFLGTILPVRAERDARDDRKGDRGNKDYGENRREQKGKSNQQRQQQQAQQQQRQRQQQQHAQQQQRRTQEQARAWQQQRGWEQQGAWRPRDNWQQFRAQQWANDHRSWSQRGGYGGYYASQSRFNQYFGNQHYFRLRSRPVIYQGYPRFQYGGYSFLMVDPWPEYWDENWYESDDVYVDYDDGYYLHNRRHPDVRIAIAITL